MNKVEECCNEFIDDLQGTFYKIENISESDKKSLGDFLFSKEEDEFFLAANIYQDWPTGRAIFLNKDRTFKIEVGRYDHLWITFTEENVTI